jgi:hypothetical protein
MEAVANSPKLRLVANELRTSSAAAAPSSPRTSYDLLVQKTYGPGFDSPRVEKTAPLPPAVEAECRLLKLRIRSASYSEFGQELRALSVFRDAGGKSLARPGRLSFDEFCRVRLPLCCCTLFLYRGSMLKGIHGAAAR